MSEFLAGIMHEVRDTDGNLGNIDLYLPDTYTMKDSATKEASQLSTDDQNKNSADTRESPTFSTAGVAGDLKKWLIFSLVEPGFLKTIRLCCVFGPGASEAFLVSNDDEVWGIGSNAAGCLGIGDTRSCLSPVKVEEISKKAVQSFAYGTGPHVLALSGDGEVYGWGHNGYSQVGNGQNTQANSPVLVFDQSPVAEIACGSYHSAIRTVSGEVWSWGQNNCGQLGSASSVNHQAPRKVGGLIANLKCTGISCGQASTVAVFENGEVYVWGLNGNGQLGLGSLTNQMVPAKIEQFKNIVIQKVACGFSHTLALTDEGLVYVWGANGLGQLGIENKTNQSIPVHMKTIHGRINEIAASHYNQISAAVTETSKVLMWGQCRGQHVTVPTETPFDSVHDVFGAFASVPVTPVPMIVRPIWENKLANAMEEHFDNPAHSDLKFLVDGKIIHVHKTILKFQCDYFRTMFQGPWIENESDTIEISQFSYPVYKAFLRYLYTGEVDLAPTDAIGLLELANSCCENTLKLQCQRLIKNGILIGNCASLYMAAVRHNAEDLEDFCFRFAMNHTTAVVQTEAFAGLPEDVMKRFIGRAARYGAFKQ